MSVIPTGIPKGICPKCKALHVGWALLNPRHQTCRKCGAALEITNGSGKVLKGYSPFTSEIYRLNAPDQKLTTPDVPPKTKNKAKD